MDSLLESFIFISAVKAAVIFATLMTTLAYLQWVERKVIAHIQVRPGPYRVGPHGLLQPLADVVKLITKEDLVPPYVNKVFYLAAPFMAITFALLSISVIPFGPQIQIGPVSTYMQMTDLNIGVLFVLAVSSMGVYGIALAGWASNNKYSLLGGLRSSAQMISYELPMSLAIAAPLLVSNTLSLRQIVEAQTGSLLHWNLIGGGQIVSFIIFLVIAAIFLVPMVQSWLLPLFWFLAKTGGILFVFIWIRATLPRLRYDQLMGFTWKFLFPVAMLNLLVTAFVVAWVSK